MKKLAAILALAFLTVSPVAAQSYGCDAQSTSYYQDPYGNAQRVAVDATGNTAYVTDDSGVSHRCGRNYQGIWSCE